MRRNLRNVVMETMQESRVGMSVRGSLQGGGGVVFLGYCADGKFYFEFGGDHYFLSYLVARMKNQKVGSY